MRERLLHALGKQENRIALCGRRGAVGGREEILTKCDMVRLGSLLLLVAALAAVAPSAANDAAKEAGTEVAAAVAEPAVAAGKQVTIKHDHTTREGNGDNLPYKGLDYLGMGYDLVKGNPHGDPDSMVRAAIRVAKTSRDQI